MYHFVRDLVHTRYPEIKGLDINLFIEQIEYIQKHYTPITMELLMETIDSGNSLPRNSVILSFDDGYIDHFTNVFPILNSKGIQGSFFPPARAITQNIVLDVNKIHFILASETNKAKIVSLIFKKISTYRNEYNLESESYYVEKLAHPNRFDTAEVILIKRLLQVELPENLRNEIVNTLFHKFVGIAEASFSKELYMNVDQLKCMKKNGMHIGSHGFDHYWLGRLTKDQQENEIDLSLSFLDTIGVDKNNWSMCYPYGNYNLETIEILKNKQCKIALTTEVEIGDISSHNPLTLPRLDTNDIPKNRNAEVNKWYEKLY